MRSTLSGIAAFLLLEAAGVSAFWRMQCGSPLLTDRIDPLVQPGVSPARHVHNIMGGNAFDKTTSFEKLQQSTCTSCQVKGDKSIYWVPALYFQSDDDKQVVQVPQKDGMLVYYIPERGGKDVEMFPKGFAMLAGNPNKRTLDESATGEAHARQMGIGFNCLNYAGTPEPFAYRRKMPSKEEMKNCVNGLRADIILPSCWDGRLDSDDHKSHMAYPSDVEDGVCPDTHKRRLITMKFETLFDVAQFSDKAGRFVWSTGDLTGYGYHGDFVNGWDPELLKAAYNDPTCVPPVTTQTGGDITQCQTFVQRAELQGPNEMNSCKIKQITGKSYAGPSPQLDGCSAVESQGAAFECEGQTQVKIDTPVKNDTPLQLKPTASDPVPMEIPTTISKSTTRSRKPKPKPKPTSQLKIASSVVQENQVKPEVTANPVMEIASVTPVVTSSSKKVKEVVVTVVETVTHTVYDEAVATVATYVPHYNRHRRHRRRNW